MTRKVDVKGNLRDPQPSIKFTISHKADAAIEKQAEPPLPSLDRGKGTTTLPPSKRPKELETLHPPRLGPIFDGSPSVPSTPVYSIQTMRGKGAGRSGPLTKLLVANRGVSYR